MIKQVNSTLPLTMPTLSLEVAPATEGEVDPGKEALSNAEHLDNAFSEMFNFLIGVTSGCGMHWNNGLGMGELAAGNPEHGSFSTVEPVGGAGESPAKVADSAYGEDPGSSIVKAEDYDPSRVGALACSSRVEEVRKYRSRISHGCRQHI